MIKKDHIQTILKGIGASSGICIGKAFILDNFEKKTDLIKKSLFDEKDLTSEVIRFKKGVKKTEEDLKRVVKSALKKTGKTPANIIETHLALIKDKMFYDAVIKTIISDKINAEWALKKVSASLKKRFNAMESPLDERAEDVSFVYRKIINNLSGAEKFDISGRLKLITNKKVILIAKDLSPVEASQLRKAKIKGFITETGSRTSHTGIIARALDIPAVMGLKEASRIIKNDQILIIDGGTGEVIIEPRDATILSYRDKSKKIL